MHLLDFSSLSFLCWVLAQQQQHLPHTQTHIAHSHTGFLDIRMRMRTDMSRLFTCMCKYSMWEFAQRSYHVQVKTLCSFQWIATIHCLTIYFGTQTQILWQLHAFKYSDRHTHTATHIHIHKFKHSELPNLCGHWLWLIRGRNGDLAAEDRQKRMWHLGIFFMHPPWKDI